MQTRIKKNKGGSALLLVLLVTMFLSTMLFACWQRSSMFFDIVVAREQYYKELFVCKAILHKVIVWARDNFATIGLQKQASLQLLQQNVSRLAQKVLAKHSSNDVWDTTIVLEPFQSDNKRAKAILIQVDVRKNKKIKRQLSCLLEQKKNRVKSEKGKTECKKAPSTFAIRCFTLGGAL